MIWWFGPKRKCVICCLWVWRKLKGHQDLMYIFSCRELKLNKNKCQDCRGTSHPISQARDDDVLPKFASFIVFWIMWWPFSWSNLMLFFFPFLFGRHFMRLDFSSSFMDWGRRVLPRSFAWWRSVARVRSATQSCVTMNLQLLGLFHASSRTGEHQQNYGNMPFFRTFNLNTWKNMRSKDWMFLRLIICIT